MRKNIKRSIQFGVFSCFLAFVLSCEKDFTDIGSNVISNTKFDTNEVLVEINAENSPLQKLQTDNISRQIGQYLLGVYANAEYEKIEASIVSQLSMPLNLKVVDKTYGADTTVVTTIDTVFLKLPYQVSLQDGNATSYDLDSIVGDLSKPFNFNVFRSNTYLNTFNPADPSKTNAYFSDATFEKTGTALNVTQNYQFTPNKNDTLFVIKRRLFNNEVATTDTLKIFSSLASTIPIPFARIPLDESRFKEMFLDKYETGEFDSQDAFNDYFRGVILEASGNEGSLISFNFTNSIASLRPSIEVYYTNTVVKSGSTVIDTISKNNSFPLNGFRVNTFKMEDKIYPSNNELKVQGAAGSEVAITLFDQNKINELRAKNWLINDASLIFYINQAADTTAAPYRMYLYKSDMSSGVEKLSQIKDAISEVSFGGISGFLDRDESGKRDKYTFRITDYISDIVSGESSFSPTLKLKVFNSSDNPTTGTDTIFRNFSWNPKAVTLFNHSPANGDRRAILKLSYSERKN